MPIRLNDIPQMPTARYRIRVDLHTLERQLRYYLDEQNLIMDPEFQRAHVWTEQQQVAFMEYMLMGGETGREITFVKSDWPNSDADVPMYLVDGKQRLEAARRFLNDEIEVFGHKISEYEDRRFIRKYFEFRICSLDTEEEVLQLYLNINAGGTPHTKEELDRVRKMLKKARGEE